MTITFTHFSCALLDTRLSHDGCVITKSVRLLCRMLRVCWWKQMWWQVSNRLKDSNWTLALSKDCINWIDCLAKPNATSNSRWAAQQLFHCCRNGFFGSQCASPERLVSTDTGPTSCTYLFPLSWDRGSQWPPAGFQRRGLWFRFQYLISFHVSRLHLSTSSWTGAQHSSPQCIH